MTSAHLIFPHQLYQNISSINNKCKIYLIEEYLFFSQYKFHKQKIAFHRASMKAYEAYLTQQGFNCIYVEANNKLSDVREMINHLAETGLKKIVYAHTTDYLLERRITITCKKNKIETIQLESQLFINSANDIEFYFSDKKKYFQTEFYIHQRKQKNILLEQGNKPLMGKWSFDAENRLKYPKTKLPPTLKKIACNKYYQEAIQYVKQNFNENYGSLDETFIYPTTYEEANHWLNNFLETRFSEFGLYEDAIVEEESVLHHSILTPMLNVGLLLPMEVIDKAIDYASNNNIPYNSLEGFVRQIIGWREFVRAVYIKEGCKQRTTNYWNFERKIPACFYTAITGIEPIDSTIKKLLKHGYNHHIERLMVLGNFMLLCEFDPDEVYKWFMEMYIDAYDWVMVPNVYGMSQFADGGLMCTKPYISGSNYIFKMSNYAKGKPWAPIWDALFWRFMNVHRNFFTANPRLAMLIKTYDNMQPEKKDALMKTAADFLNTL